MIGTIIKVMDKGYGFIRSNSTEYFFHRDDLSSDINWIDLCMEVQNGAKVDVEFDEVASAKGPRAATVRRY